MLYEIDGKPAFRLTLYDHSVAHKWKKLIQTIYIGDGEDIDHKRTFLYLNTPDEIRQMLLQAIHGINTFVKKELIRIPTKEDWGDPNLYNDLHMAFEKLSGEFDKPTRLFQVAPEVVKEHIRDLNYCVHMLEHDGNSDRSVLQIQWSKARKNTPRIKLKDDEYDLIQFHTAKNEVYLAYNELGKDTMDLWRDNLPATYEKAKDKHYIGADILISFYKKENIFSQAFLEWCSENNINPFEKKKGIGLLPIGKISTFDTQRLTKDSKIDIIEGVK